MTYITTKLRSDVNVSHIITIHYFEYMKDFYFVGESHNFWEVLCVDKGEVEVQADFNTYHLKPGDIIFHKPMEFHSIKSIAQSAPNLIAISFISPSNMSLLEGKYFHLAAHEKMLISKIIVEAGQAFSTPLNVPSIEQVKRSKEAPIGSEQLIKIYLEQLLIGFMRKVEGSSYLNSKLNTKDSHEKTFNKICHYLDVHLDTNLTVQTICNDNLISRSSLQLLFHKKVQCGVIEYFHGLKMNHVKQLIREGEKNFSQIADELGYNSLAHFSKQFKKTFSMSPTEYASSIKLLSENMNLSPSIQREHFHKPKKP